ncbi:flavin reductase family protein [Sphingomonas sp. LR61]|uniref:flavin reductase family protein n=1 Tax=Sphingomonas sp. LR61 TaxID=3050234 RepID=UPI002FE3CD5E
MPDEAPANIAEAYKSAFRGHPAGVAVITAEGPDGPTGLTASSVASVAVDPPVLVFSLSTNSGSAGVVLGAPVFVVHLVDSLSVALARRFASTGSPTADDPIWGTLPSGDRYLPSAASALRCRPLHDPDRQLDRRRRRGPRHRRRPRARRAAGLPQPGIPLPHRSFPALVEPRNPIRNPLIERTSHG